MTNATDLLALLAMFAALAPLVHSITEAIRNVGPFARLSNRLIAAGVAFVLSASLSALGVLRIPVVEPGWVEALASGVLGMLVGVFGGGKMHDLSRQP